MHLLSIFPFLRDLEKNVQKSFRKYLEIRGIKPSITNFLSDYLHNKDDRECLKWLENLKKFVEASNTTVLVGNKK